MPFEVEKDMETLMQVLVKYSAKMTDKLLNGNVACELSARTHGVAQWWVEAVKTAQHSLV